MKHIKRLLLLLNILIVPQIIVAQYKFTASFSQSGTCSGLYNGGIELASIKSMVNHYNSTNYNSMNECESARARANSQTVTIGSCHLRITTSPCSGPGGNSGNLSFSQGQTDGNSNINFLGPSHGKSFYSPNFANEVKYWSEEDIKKRILNNDIQIPQLKSLETNDPDYDNERAKIKENGFIIDTNKPYRSLNIDEDWSSPDFDNVNVEWEFIKSSKGLNYNTIDEFSNDMIKQSKTTQDYILNIANMSLETFQHDIIEVGNYIERWYNEESLRLSKSLKIAEEQYDIANFLSEYKGYLTICYMNSMSDASADQGTIKAFGKTRDEIAFESIAKLEAGLKDKYKLKDEDIAKLKKIIDDENKVQEYILKTKGLEIDKTIDKTIEYSKEISNKAANEIGKRTITGAMTDKTVSFEKALDLGVLINDNIALLGLVKNRDAYANAVKSIKDNQERTKNIHDNEIQKIENLLLILDNNSHKRENEITNMSQKNKLEWSKKTIDTLAKMQSNKSTGPYNIFPDRFKNLYIKEGKYIECK